jgi:hypothetical protein
MIWLKSCPRCGGDLFEERDWYAHSVKCFQCGRTLTLAQERQLKAKAAGPGPVAVAAGSQDFEIPHNKKRKKAA